MNWYDANAAELAVRYEALDPQDLHAWMADILPSQPSLVVDVGAGTGRDAAWFATAGHEVVAIEPSSAMRAAGQRLHDVPQIRWVDGCGWRLDGLAVHHACRRAGLTPRLLAVQHQHHVVGRLEQQAMHQAAEPLIRRLPRPEMHRQHAPAS